MQALGYGNFNTEIGISVGDVWLSNMVDYVIGGRQVERYKGRICYDRKIDT